MIRRLSLPCNKIRALYLEGWTITKLANKYYCSYYAMWSRLQEMGVVREKKHVWISPAQMKSDYEIQGLSLQEIADGYGVTVETIARKKKKAKKWPYCRIGEKGNFTPIIVQFLRKEKKLKIREVSEMMGLSPRMVCYLQKIDIKELQKKFVVSEVNYGTTEHL